MNGRSLAAGSIRTETPGQAMQLAGRPVVDTSARDAGQTGASMHATAVELWLDRIAMAPPAEALNQARALWASLLDAGTYPTLAQTAELLADFQFMAIRDRLIADIPGMDEPIHRILLGQTEQTPRWSRLEWAEQILLHLYTNGAPQYAAPVLLAVGYISWWQGRSSKAIQFMELALDADPRYQLALLVRQMLRSGMAAGWTSVKHQSSHSYF
ncbi:MAG TPA: DUF4192 family protein [Micrococcaceae bacterium]|nr:DUF4192 family protein [Micrococcaceae bacterium]